MSQFPSQPQGTPPNPFSSSPYGDPPPPRRSRAWLWILLGAGGMGALICCGCAGLMYFGFTQAGRGLVTQLNADPVAKEHLGTVRSATLDVAAMVEVAEQNQKDGGQPVMVFSVRGEKGTGRVHAHQAADGQSFRDAKLVLPTGDEFELGF